MIRQALFLLSFRFRQIARGAQEAPGRAAFRTAILGGTAAILWIGLYFFFKRGLDFLADYLPEPDLQIPDAQSDRKLHQYQFYQTATATSGGRPAAFF